MATSCQLVSSCNGVAPIEIAGETSEAVIPDYDSEGSLVERDETSFAAGCEAAQADIAAGRLVYRWTGHAGHWGHWIVIQLDERFGVKVNDGFGICFVDTTSRSFDEGYNSILVAEIDRRHGKGAFESMLKESRSQSEESLWDAKQAWRDRQRLSEPDKS